MKIGKSTMNNLTQKFASLILLVLSVVSLAGCFSSGTNTNQNSAAQIHSTTGAVFANNTIDVGYISYPPGFIVDPNTKQKSGIFNDILVEIAKRNGLTINYKEEVTWATMIESLKTDRVDLIANPVWATNERKANADFSKPVYFSPIAIYVRSDDNRFDGDRNKLNDPAIKVAAIEGEMGASIAKADFPQAQLQPFPNNVDIAQMFLEVQNNRKDVTFAEPMIAYDYMQKNPGKLKNISENSPVRNFPNSYMYKKGEQKIADFLNAEIDKLLKDGTIDKIIDKYSPFQGAIIKVNDPRAVDKQ